MGNLLLIEIVKGFKYLIDINFLRFCVSKKSIAFVFSAMMEVCVT